MAVVVVVVAAVVLLIVVYDLKKKLKLVGYIIRKFGLLLKLHIFVLLFYCTILRIIGRLIFGAGANRAGLLIYASERISMGEPICVCLHNFQMLLVS